MTYSVRRLAEDVIAAFRQTGDAAQRLELIREPMRKLVARPDLASVRFSPRGANHIEESRLLYFDGELSISLDYMLKGRPAPVHDHGNDRGNHLWEAIAVHAGKLKHLVYERQDDRSRAGYAELRVVEDAVMQPGDVTIIAPPAEIHGFEALSDDVRFITVAEGHFPPDRQYFKPEENKAIFTTPKEIAAAGGRL